MIPILEACFAYATSLGFCDLIQYSQTLQLVRTHSSGKLNFNRSNCPKAKVLLIEHAILSLPLWDCA